MISTLYASLGLFLLASLLHGAVGQLCPTGTRLTPTDLEVSADVGETVTFRCYDASTDTNLNGARFFKDGELITIDGGKYSNPLAYVLNIANIALADEGEYTCLPQSSCGNGATTMTGYLLVQPRVAANVQQMYTAFLGEDIVLECGLQFGSLMETQNIEWRTKSGDILASTANPGSPGDSYHLNLQTFQLTIERVPLSAEQLSPFGGYTCRRTGSRLLPTDTIVNAAEVYLGVEDDFSISVDATTLQATVQFPNRAPFVSFSLLFYALPEGSSPSACNGREAFHQVTAGPASYVEVDLSGDVEANVIPGLYVIAVRTAVNGVEGDCSLASGSIKYGTSEVTSGPLGTGASGLTTGALVGIILAVIVGVLAVTAICVIVAYLCKRGMNSREKTPLSFSPKPPQSLEEEGTMEHRQDTLKKVKSVTSFKGSIFTLSKPNLHNGSDFELHLDNANMYVSHKERNTSVSESWCYSPKLQTFPRTLSNSAHPPSGRAPHYQYETATFPLHGHDHEKAQMEHPLTKHYDTPKNHPVGPTDDEPQSMTRNQPDGGEGSKKGVETEAGNYEVPVSFTEHKPRDYRSQTPSPETLVEASEGSGQALEDEEGSEADVLAPPSEFNNPMLLTGGLTEEEFTSSQSTDFDTREGATFV